MVEQRTIDFSAIKDPAAVEIIEFLLEENRLLRERVRLLEEEVARLKKNSSTSSKPPSSDITKPSQEQRQPGGRKIGGQPRHPGKQRDLLPPEKVDHVVPLSISTCPDCGEALQAKQDLEELVTQTVELPEKPVEITEYHRPAGWCERCGKVHYAPLPAGVIEGQLFGPRLQALIGYMKGNFCASFTELQQFCTDVLGVEVSRGMLVRVIGRVHQALEPPYQELQAHIPAEKALNIDESGWYDRGVQYWIWLFCTPLRDIKFLTTLPDTATQEFGHKVLRHFELLFRHWHARATLPPDIFVKRCEKIQRRLFTFLIKAEPPKGAALTMKKRLMKHWASLFRFVREPALYQPTNNAAEQTMRVVVRIRRQTQGTRSEWGRRWCSCVLSVIGTCRKQKRSAWEFIRQAVYAKNFGGNFPSLLPT